MRDKSEKGEPLSFAPLGVNPIDDWDMIRIGTRGGVWVDEEQMKRILAEVLNRPTHCLGCQGNCEGIKT